MAKPAVKPSQQVALSEETTSLTTAVPSFMQQYAGQGTENIGADDVETARVKLLQALSPECEEFEEAKPGVFWHSVAQVAMGSQVPIIPIYIDKQAILWRPQDDGGGILARSTDMVHWSPPNGEFRVKINKATKEVTWKVVESVAASRLLEWGSSDPGDSTSQPAATKMINVVCAFPSFPGLPPAVVTLQRTSIRASKKLLGQLSMVRAPCYGTRFLMEAVEDQNNIGQKYKNFKFSPIGMVTSEQEFMEYRGLYDRFKAQGVRIKDIDSLAEEDAAVNAGAIADPNAPAY